MELKTFNIERPEDANIIIGQTHFIKSVEDIAEAMVNSVPGIRFGLAFCEASGPCLVRKEGNDRALTELAARNALNIGAGHTFIIILKGGFPINVLRNVKDVYEVCNIYCATANPVEVVVVETGLGRGIVGVIDGEKPKGIEGDKERADRHDFLRRIGYKY